MSRRMAKILAWGVGILVAVTLAVVAFVPDIEVRIPEVDVREAIRDRLPVETDLPEIELALEKADVDFVGTGSAGRVGIFGEVEMAGFGLAGTGSVDTLSAVRYEDGAFYLTELQLEDIELTPSLATKAKLAVLKKTWETFLDDVGEEIRTQEGDEALAEFLHVRNTLGPTVRVALNDALGEIPVYRLRGDAAHWAARLVLKEVAFTDDEAIAVLSPAQALITISTAIIGALVAVLLAWEHYRSQPARPPEDT